MEKFWSDFARDLDVLYPILSEFSHMVEKRFPKLAKPVTALLEKIEQKKTQPLTEKRVVKNLASAPQPIVPQVVGGSHSLLPSASDLQPSPCHLCPHYRIRPFVLGH